MTAKGILAVAVLGLALQARAEPGYTVRDTELKAEPQATAATITSIPADTAVTVGERRGGWYSVEHDDQQGWLPMLRLRFNREPRRQSDSGIDKISNVLDSGRSGSAVATGVRGLDAEALRQARPNEAELRKLEAAAVEPAQAEQFAREAKLTRRAELPYPAADPAAEADVDVETDDLI